MRTRSGRHSSPEPAPVVESALLLAVAASLLAGAADPERAALHLPRVLGLSIPPAIIAFQAWRRPSAAVRRGLRVPLWVPAFAVLAAVLTQGTGGPTGPLAMLGLVAAGSGSLSSGPRMALPSILLLTVSVLLPGWLGLAAVAPWPAQLAWGVGVLFCGLLPGRFLAGERRTHDQTRARLQAIEDETGGLQLESSATLPAVRAMDNSQAEREREIRAIARELQADIDRVCSTLMDATGALAATVYRPDGDEFSERLVAVARAGDQRGVLGSISAREGIFGAAFKNGSPVHLPMPQDDDPRLVHRSEREHVAAVLALPLVDGDRRWGVIVLDADDPASLEGARRKVAGDLGDLVSRLISRAVDLSAVREGLRENHAFFQASREVSKHVRIDEITEAVVRSAGDFVKLDGCALALTEQAGEKLRVVAASGWSEPPPTDAFPNDSTQSLLALALRYRTTLDRPDLVHNALQPVLFGEQAGPLRDLASLLVLPIFPPGGGDAPALGALVVAREQLPNFTTAEQEQLEILLNQAGAAISNGRLFAEHEERSITDGMTNLPNHRRFQEVFAEKLARCARSGEPLSLLLMDIDKFKSVNDNYGHPMGDEVIRRLAGVLRSAVRDGMDLAARYGGEEFCILLEDTEAEGAAVLADRIREAFKDEVFVHREGNRPVSFHCSVSIGVTSWPRDGEVKTLLIERADQALYQSKESGRDRTTLWRTIPVGGGLRAV